MDDVFFHVEQRSAWVRTGTHTVVYDRDQDYPRFASDPSGTVRRLIRIWLAETRDGRDYPIAYLGAVTFCLVRPSYRDLLRLFRMASRAAKAAGRSAKELRDELAELVRQYMREEYGT